jgi:hypothetical protein
MTNAKWTITELQKIDTELARLREDIDRAYRHIRYLESQRQLICQRHANDEAFVQRRTRLEPLGFINDRRPCPECGRDDTSTTDDIAWDCDNCGHHWLVTP